MEARLLTGVKTRNKKGEIKRKNRIRKLLSGTDPRGSNWELILRIQGTGRLIKAIT